MDDIFDTLLQTIEESAFPIFYAKSEYRREQFRIEQHMQWFSEHLDDEAQTHLEKLRKAELELSTLEREALVRLALAAGIRFALPG